MPMHAVALYDYEPEEPDELAFGRGDALRVLRMQEDDWWFGYRAAEPSVRGLFPSNYVTREQPRANQDQRQAGRARPGYSRGFESRGGVEDEELGHVADDDWEYSSQAPRSKLAVVRQLRTSAKSAEYDRGRPDDGGDDPQYERDEEGKDDGRSRERYGRREWSEGPRERSQRQSFRFQPLVDSSIEEEPSDHDEGDQDGGRSGGQQQQYLASASPHGEVWLDRDAQNEVEEEESAMSSEAHAVATDKQRQTRTDTHEHQRREKEANAAMVIARGLRRHREAREQRLRRQQQLENRRMSNRRRWANQVIAEALGRRVQRRRRLAEAQAQLRSVLVIQKWISGRRRLRQQKEEAAVVRVQRVFRQHQAYRRWKERVEKRQEALRSMRRKQREAKQQQQQEQKQQEQYVKPKREQIPLQKDASLGVLAATSSSTKSSPSRSPSASPPRAKPRKIVMKKEAVDLINELVKQQLNATLRDRDDKVDELQRMVAMLQDIVQKQSVMLVASNNQLLELRRQRGKAEAARHHDAQSPTIHTPSPPAKHPSSTASSPAKPSGANQSMLPRLVPDRGAQPTRLRAPRPIHFTSKLPVLVSGRGEGSPRLKKR